MARFADDFISPLLPSKETEGGTVATSVNSDEQREYGSTDIVSIKPTVGQVFKSLVAILVAVGGAAASISSFILVPTPAIMVYVAGGICLMNLPIVIYKERKILFLPSRQKEVDQLQASVKQLESECDILEDEIEYLLGHASHFTDIEQELLELANAQGYNIDELMDLIRLNEETMDLLRENLRQKVIEDMIGIVIRSDKQPNQIIDRVEAKLLALKITVKLEAYGIIFDEEKFLQAVALHPTMMGVAGTVRKLLPPDEEHGDDVTNVTASSFASGKDDLYDMFYMRQGQERRGFGLSAAQSTSRASLARRRQSVYESRLSLIRASSVGSNES